MTVTSCSKELLIWNPQFGGQEDFLVVSTKHLKLLAVKSARKTPSTLDEATSLSELHLPSFERVFPYVDAKCTTVGIRGCYSSLLCSYPQQNTQTHTLTGKNLKVTP
jgi:hypothetical protein